MEARKFCSPETFSFMLLLTTKGNCWHINIGHSKMDKVLGRMENSRLLKPKQKILWQLENNCKVTRICFAKHWSVTGV